MMSVLVTGAGGFVGGAAVGALRAQGHHVRACVRHPTDAFDGLHGVEAVELDITRPEQVDAALDGVEAILHFAAATDPKAPAGHLQEVNVEGTRILWQAAARHGVQRALYCSTVAVYGLLGRRQGSLDEDTVPRAVEPYGRSKLDGERAALAVAASHGPRTAILRPAAIMGPESRLRLSTELRRAAISRIALPGLLRGGSFSFVHVEDVARASVHLLEARPGPAEIFNLAVDPPISFDAAADAYNRALRRARRPMRRARAVARISACARRLPTLTAAVQRLGGGRWFYPVGRAGFDITYSSHKVMDTGFTFQWQDFEEVLLSCFDDPGWA